MVSGREFCAGLVPVYIRRTAEHSFRRARVPGALHRGCKDQALCRLPSLEARINHPSADPYPLGDVPGTARVRAGL